MEHTELEDIVHTFQEHDAAEQQVVPDNLDISKSEHHTAAKPQAVPDNSDISKSEHHTAAEQETVPDNLDISKNEHYDNSENVKDKDYSTMEHDGDNLDRDYSNIFYEDKVSNESSGNILESDVNANKSHLLSVRKKFSVMEHTELEDTVHTFQEHDAAEQQAVPDNSDISKSEHHTAAKLQAVPDNSDVSKSEHHTAAEQETVPDNLDISKNEHYDNNENVKDKNYSMMEHDGDNLDRDYSNIFHEDNVSNESSGNILESDVNVDTAETTGVKFIHSEVSPSSDFVPASEVNEIQIPSASSQVDSAETTGINYIHSENSSPECTSSEFVSASEVNEIQTPSASSRKKFTLPYFNLPNPNLDEFLIETEKKLETPGPTDKKNLVHEENGMSPGVNVEGKTDYMTKSTMKELLLKKINEKKIKAHEELSFPKEFGEDTEKVVFSEEEDIEETFSLDKNEDDDSSNLVQDCDEAKRKYESDDEDITIKKKVKVLDNSSDSSNDMDTYINTSPTYSPTDSQYDYQSGSKEAEREEPDMYEELERQHGYTIKVEGEFLNNSSDSRDTVPTYSPKYSPTASRYDYQLGGEIVDEEHERRYIGASEIGEEISLRHDSSCSRLGRQVPLYIDLESGKEVLPEEEEGGSQLNSSIPSYQPAGGFCIEENEDDSHASITSEVEFQLHQSSNKETDSQSPSNVSDFRSPNLRPVLISGPDFSGFALPLDNLPVSHTGNIADIFSSQDLSNVCSGKFQSADPEKSKPYLCVSVLHDDITSYRENFEKSSSEDSDSEVIVSDMDELPKEKVEDFIDKEAELSEEDDVLEGNTSNEEKFEKSSKITTCVSEDSDSEGNVSNMDELPKEKVDDFFDKEAELSGEDDGLDGDIESDTESRLGDLCVPDEEVPAAEDLRDEIADIHMKHMRDEDDELLKEIKEKFLEDGELNNEGAGRIRKFAWKNNDMEIGAKKDSSSDSDSDVALDDTWSSLNQEKAKWRQEKKDEDASDELNSSNNRKALKMNIIGKQNISKLEGESSKNISQKRPRGSFLSIDDETSNSVLKKLKMSEEDLGTRTTKHFVFLNDVEKKSVPSKSFTPSQEPPSSNEKEEAKNDSIFNNI